MTKSMRALLMGAALSGFAAGTTANAVAQQPTRDPKPKTSSDCDKESIKQKDEKHGCRGQNSCKGKGGCNSGDNGCRGKNCCTGKGGCSTAKHSCKGQNECKGQGGCNSSDNGCKGKNSCKGKGGCGPNHCSRGK